MADLSTHAGERCIVIAEDHPLFRDALRLAVEGMSGDTRIVEAEDLTSLKTALGELEDPDLVLLDLDIPGVSGFSGLLHLRAQYPQLPVAIVSATDDGVTVRRAIGFGASGFISKSAPLDDIRSAIETVLAGEVSAPSNIDDNPDDEETQAAMAGLSSLTPQQSRVLAMIAEGLLNKQIAYELSVSEATVKAHVSAVLQKLNVDSRTQAVIKLSRLGLNSAAST
ncbi:MAG: response regulator transcription factor [Pseudomonadota bacterium]